jgi:hypothetical protein
MTKAIAAALLLCASVLHADDAPLVAALKAHRTTLALRDGKLTGAGAQQLIDEGKRSEFFLIGEDHGFAETPRLAAALFAALQPFGYRHIAAEVGPRTTTLLEATARRGGLPALETLLAAHPQSVPFFGWREEAEYLADVVTRSPGVAHVVWGLDQEYIFSPSLLLGAKSGTMLTSIELPDDAELRESAAIYKDYMAGRGYASNLARSLLMKRHFRADYEEAVAAGERHPRVLLKFGSNHLIRGRSFTNVYDLGTLLPEVAAMNGETTFHLIVLARSGDKNAAVFDPKPLFEASDASEWTLLDLRALRPDMRTLQAGDGLARVIWGYDAALILPAAHPATTIE